ncbi:MULTISPECIES: hypothetical protein [unclassified Streptomyces]|uniref:hypothetical protein n=1 Tax=unclassified Streptomyces TaxID=2593676 RepID=UPI000FFE9F05|nr:MULTISPECIES: hypothetical protein [unclassified Streptomyces]
MHEEIAERVWDAVGRWVEGRREESVQILATLAETQTPSMMYGVALGIATVAKAALTKMHGSRLVLHIRELAPPETPAELRK